MNYNLNWLIEKYENEELSYLFFWGHKKSKSENINQTCFSQWYPSPFRVANDDNIENPNYWKGLNLLGFALMEVRDYFPV